jgi:hypothetical protein
MSKIEMINEGLKKRKGNKKLKEGRRVTHSQRGRKGYD